MADGRAVIIGGGITGTLCAHALLKEGWDVTLLESAHIGAGSSSRTAAGIRQQFSTPDTVRAMRHAMAFYERFTDEMHGESSPLVQNGYLFLVEGEDAWAEAQSRVAMQQRVGLSEVESLAPNAVGERFPWVDVSTISGATWCPTDGFLLPHIVYHDAAREVRRMGGTLLQGAPVTGADHQGDRVMGVHTPKGKIEGDLFLDCTNAWTHRTARILGGYPLDVAPLKRYLWFLLREGSLTPETMRDMPLTILPSGIYCRPENEDTLLMGKKHDTPPDVDFSYDDQDLIEPDYSHKTGFEAMPFDLWMQLAEVLPPMGEFGGITATTCGYYGTTPDHNPFIGFDPIQSNLIRLVGFSGHGAMLGPFTAKVATSLAAEGRDLSSVTLDYGEVSLSPFALGRNYENHEKLVI